MLVLLLRLGGVITVSAFLAMFLPVEWMSAIHEAIGLGEFPRAPVVVYLARLIAALYGLSRRPAPAHLDGRRPVPPPGVVCRHHECPLRPDRDRDRSPGRHAAAMDVPRRPADLRVWHSHRGTEQIASPERLTNQRSASEKTKVTPERV